MRWGFPPSLKRWNLLTMMSPAFILGRSLTQQSQTPSLFLNSAHLQRLTLFMTGSVRRQHPLQQLNKCPILQLSWLICKKNTAGMQRKLKQYVWRISLMGGDSIKLLEEEAQGPWGPRVSITIHNGRQPWSLTQRAAYWAGGLNSLERGEPISIPTPTLGNLRQSMQ